jgi:hypothetical protein
MAGPEVAKTPKVARAHKAVASPLHYAALVLALGCALVVASGCAMDRARTTPVYPVFVNAQGDQGAGLYVSVSLSRPSKDDESVLSMVIWNHSGRDVLLARIGEYPHINVWYEVTCGRSWCAGELFPAKVGYCAPFDLVVSTPFPKQVEPKPYNKPMMVVVARTIPSCSGPPYASLHLRFRLLYYALGATLPARIEVDQTVRVSYGAREASAETE